MAEAARIDAVSQELLRDLTPEQRAAVMSRAKYLCLIAGAGSGKTRVLTRRIAYGVRQGVYDARRVLAVTFTRRAAWELKQRLYKLGLHQDVTAGTFHSIALQQLKRLYGGGNFPQSHLIAHPMPLVIEALKRTSMGGDLSAKAKKGTDPIQVLNEINWCKARLIKPDAYVQVASEQKRQGPCGTPERFVKAFEAYEEAKKQKLDFNDLLELARMSMESDPEHAKVQRWLHQHLLVDEFQDVNPLQFGLLKTWLGTDTTQINSTQMNSTLPNSTLTVVGDPLQAIYGWNGSDPEVLNNIETHFDEIETLELRTNFRSTPEILGAAARVWGSEPQPSVYAPGAKPIISECLGENEAKRLARAVRYHQPVGKPWGVQAVLARTNALLVPLREELEKQGIPVVVHKGESMSDSVKPIADDAAGSENGFGAGSGSTNAAGSANAAVSTNGAGAGGDFREPDYRNAVNLLTFHTAKGLEWQIVHLVGIEDGYVPMGFSDTDVEEERRLLGVAITRARKVLNVIWCNQRTVTNADGKERIRKRQPSPWLELIEAPAETYEIDPRKGIEMLKAQLSDKK